MLSLVPLLFFVALLVPLVVLVVPLLLMLSSLTMSTCPMTSCSLLLALDVVDTDNDVVVVIGRRKANDDVV